jgi:hypothetical protein
MTARMGPVPAVDRRDNPFAVLRDHLDRVELIAERTLAGIPRELRDETLCQSIRVQFAREALRQMAEILR